MPLKIDISMPPLNQRSAAILCALVLGLTALLKANAPK